MTDISVTVLIATFNRAHLIAETLNSILAQTRLPEQIVVINDGSTDETSKILSAYSNHIEVIEQANQGKPAALNLGLSRAHGSHILIFDDDDILLPEALATHIDFLTSHPEFDYSYSASYEFNGEFSLAALPKYLWHPLPPIEAEEYLISNLEDLKSNLQGMLIPKYCYDAVGGFNASLLRAQDHEIALRIARRFRPGRIDIGTHAIRAHDQIRGPSFAQHNFKDRRLVWRQFQRQIFKRIYDDFELHEYVAGPHVSGQTELPADLERQALLQRAYVMANRGLYKRALLDLERAIREIDAKMAFTKREQLLLSELMFFADRRFIPSSNFFRQVGDTVARDPIAVRLAARGLYWTYSRHRAHAPTLLRMIYVTTQFMAGCLQGRKR